MSKKSRSARTKNRAPEANRNQDYNKSVNTAAPSSKANRQPVATASVALPMSHEYVKSDLIHIGIIAAVLILIMIILAFIPGLNT
jgi:hypothetical protein